ncbi:PUX10, partial [Symbiodinium microadriaticum]
QVLCSGNVLRHVNGQDVLVWGGNIWDAEPYSLSMQLKVSTFPFLALMTCESDRSVQILDRIQGFIDAPTLDERLQNCLVHGRSQIARARNAQIRREEGTMLRSEQDREYQEMMEADRRRQEERQLERERVQREEEEEAQRKELEDALALSVQLAKEDQLNAARRMLSQKHVPVGDEVALIRFQLPHGVKVSEKFHRNDKIGMLYAFLSVHFAESASDVSRFVISTNFPKKDLTDKEATLEQEGLYPRGALFVQDLDA